MHLVRQRSMKGKPSPEDPIPLRTVRSIGGEVGPTSAFNLPEGWVVENKPRSSLSSNPGKVDKYYIELSTGKRFRSMPNVKQYLQEKDNVSTPKLLLKQAPEEIEAESKNDMQIVPVSDQSSGFELPYGWTIEAHRRSSSSTIDRYYIEPETGKKFRSLVSVKRHLNEAINESASYIEPKIRKKSPAAAVKRSKNEEDFESAVICHTPRSTVCSANFVLPDNWVVERHRRGGKTSRVVDKYYIEPETGQRFRSLVSVERYLNEKEEKEYAMPLKDFKRPKKLQVSDRLNSKGTTVSEEISCQEVSIILPTKSEANPTMPTEDVPDNDSGPSDHSDTPKKTEAAEESEAPNDHFGIGSPPSSVNWVLAGPAGDMWNPYLDDFMVPESTKQKWSETFISSLNDEK